MLLLLGCTRVVVVPPEEALRRNDIDWTVNSEPAGDEEREE
jgi:hypothetical protein